MPFTPQPNLQFCIRFYFDVNVTCSHHLSTAFELVSSYVKFSTILVCHYSSSMKISGAFEISHSTSLFDSG
jgi:hypothetical protein